ncbi:hypothetical protein BH10ACI4_BH10ACI4_31530 [soil metagenome]
MSWDAAWGFDRLVGTWRLERVIPEQGQMSGLASFEPAEGGCLLYRESGQLTLQDGTTLRSEQRYLYEPIEGGFAVRFHGSHELFETVLPIAAADGEWVGTAEHLCKADSYASEYIFRAEGSFQIRHTVHGPRKAYVVQTLYVRQVSASAP